MKWDGARPRAPQTSLYDLHAATVYPACLAH
jgi:hypothetical protein